MRIIICFLSFLLMSSCSPTHNIKISKPPCLYPFVNYDFTLCQPFLYTIDDTTYNVPQGFTTNLASIPRILWSLYSPNKANTIPAAIIHDYLYFCPGDMSRSEADRIFYDALLYKHVTTRTAFKYWLAVRTFGYSHFNEGAVCNYSVSHFDNSNGLHRDKASS